MSGLGLLWRRAGTVLGCCAGAVALSGAPASAEAQGAVRVVVEVHGAEPGTGATVYAVRVLAEGVALASYQGRMRFEAGALEVLRATTPPGRGGEARLLNVDSLSAGMVRFAAFAPDRFASDEAFRFVARPRPGGVPARLRVSLELAGTPNGDMIRAAALIPAEGLAQPAEPKSSDDA